MALVALASIAAGEARAQRVPLDTVLQRSMDEVVVTATRGAQHTAGPAIPSDVFTAEDVEVRGLSRLGDLLGEIGGYTTVHAFGTGLQVQGLGPEYTLVLMDGEPVIGRLNGTLDLDRLGLSGVERVEVVRGPFSSLYGSDALAGVVNLISRTPREPFRAEGSVRLESDGTADAATDVAFRRGGVNGGGTLRHYRSEAYDLDRTTPAPTFPEYSGTEATLRLAVPLPFGIGLGLRGRFGIEDQRDGIDVSLPPGSAPLTGQGLRNEWSLSAAVDRALGTMGRGTARLYTSRFSTETALTADSGAAITSRFDQWYHKGELQLERLLGTAHLVTAGAGFVLESVAADRIGGGARDTRGSFAFVQEQWRASPAVEATASARLDVPGDYGARISPAAAVLLHPTDSARLRASVGSGFKAPTFQQRYLDFTNAAAGYTVVGSSDVGDVLDDYERQGLVERYESAAGLTGTLRPETSRSVNLGGETHRGGFTLRVNAFYNHVADLIEIVPVATLTNGRQVYTYVNLDRVRTRGIELGADVAPLDWLEVGLRYQYLDAVDLGVLEDIDAGRLFRRENGVDRLLRRDDYGGLFGRSRHSGSVDVRLHTPLRRLTASARGVIRSSYGDFDRNGNLVLDDESEYVGGYVLLNGTLSYAAAGWLTLQAGVENALDYTDPAQAPALPGRRWFGGIRVTRVNH